MTTCRWLVWVGVVLVATSSLAQSPAERVEAARKLVTGGKFKEAVAELDAVAKVQGLDRATVASVYEVQGLAWGGLKQAPKAKTAFQKLLVLEPAFKLKGKVPPKATAAFKDAKKWVAQRGGGGLKAEQLTPEIKDKVVTALYISVENDLMTLAKSARVHLKLDTGGWQVREVPAQATTSVEAGGKVVQWWLELLGDNGAVLLVLGSEAEPIVDAVPGSVIPKAGGAATVAKKEPPKTEPAKPEPVKQPEKKPDAPVAEAKPKLTPEEPVEAKPDLAAKGPKKGKGPRILPWVLIGAGVVSAGVATIFAVQSSGARSQVTNPTVDAQTGYVVSITRAEALEYEQKAQTNAVVANTLWGVGGGLVAGGVVAFLVGD
ncbi:MAG: hypothetical protein IT380_29635 [Myxococcales bacterium]|nr:hypothetical protein [Myxococcales bacterium]